jgi:chemotaxis signal transduction protein
MSLYKGIEIDRSLVGIIRHMAGVEDYREGLGKLQSSWDILTLLGQLTGAATEMSATREAFERLTGELLNHLGKETQRKAIAELRAKTQISIDILVRNLFERTADIGFLAADDDIRKNLLDGSIQKNDLEQRFDDYVEKYSVYSDIILFSNTGQISARLSQHPAQASQHVILDMAKTTTAAHVEYFGEADFLPPGKHLIYSYRVYGEPEQVIGVLILVFKLTDEMQGIFANLVSKEDPTLLAAITAEGVVVASASTIQLPIGTQLSPDFLHTQGEVIRLAGREYVAVACKAHSYQGYPGPGWYGLGLIPLEFAFEPHDAQLLGHIAPAVLDAVTSHPLLFSDELREIPERAERIQENLNRSVWNGSVRQVDAAGSNASFAKTLLWEISNTGRKTQAVFEQSIGNLHQTVVATLLQNGISQAAFAIDVMDRNLYERANDCRWWALNTTFRRTLATPAMTPEAVVQCTKILQYINGLYTVYHNLILFNGQGQVIAVSNPEASGLINSRLHEEWVGRCLALSSSQGYVVSKFTPSPLYGNQATYIYAAAIRDLTGHKTIGGIAIVFDGYPQFSAMLSDALPRDATGKQIAGTMALFTQRDGKILASTDAAFPIGGYFPVSDEQKKLVPGKQLSAIIESNGTYFALGAALSAGYREFKISDGYCEDVLAVIAYPLGNSCDLTRKAEKKNSSTASQNGARRIGIGKEVIEVATFFIGQQWLGLPVTEVVEAIGAEELTPVFGGNNDLVAGVKMYRGNLISVLHLQRLLEPGSPVSDTPRQIVVIRTKGKMCMGLLVDELGEIPEIAREEIQPVSHLASKGNALTVGIVNGMQRTGDRYGILSILAAERFCQRINCQCPVGSQD